MSRTLVVFAAVGALILAGAFAFRPDARADAPRLPSNEAEVLERLPRSGPADRKRAELRQSLATRPDDLQAALALAKLDIETSRRRADPRYLGQAQAALGAWWDSPSPPEPVVVLRATIRQSLHDFDGALADLDRALAQAPDDAQAWITRSVVLSVRGRYAEAKRSCEPLQRLTWPTVFTVCDASVDALTGRAAQSYERIAQAVRAAPSIELRDWALSSLAEIAARLGRRDEAGALFQQALASDADDPYTLSAYADLLLDEGRAREAASLLAGRLDNDNLLLRLVLAERSIGSPTAAADTARLAARYEAVRLRGDSVHRREEARFALEVSRDARAAVALARANWDVQREPWDLRVLLEAALAAKDAAAAAPALAFLDENHLEDPTIQAVASRLRRLR